MVSRDQIQSRGFFIPKECSTSLRIMRHWTRWACQNLQSLYRILKKLIKHRFRFALFASSGQCELPFFDARALTCSPSPSVSFIDQLLKLREIGNSSIKSSQKISLLANSLFTDTRNSYASFASAKDTGITDHWLQFPLVRETVRGKKHRATKNPDLPLSIFHRYLTMWNSFP